MSATDIRAIVRKPAGVLAEELTGANIEQLEKDQYESVRVAWIRGSLADISRAALSLEADMLGGTELSAALMEIGRRMEGRTGLTLKEIAILLDGVEVPDGTARRLAPFLRQDPRLADEIAELEQMAQDAGIRAEQPERFTTAHDNDRDFRKLLTAPEWERPDEVLDPDVGFDIDELLRIAEARLARSPNPLLGEVKQKLERAAAERQAVDRMVERFLEGLLRLPAKQAEALIAETERRYLDRISPGEA